MAEQPSDGSDARVARGGRYRVGLTVDSHGAELIHGEFRAPIAGAFLTEKHRAWRGEPYGRRYYDEKRGKQRDSQQCEYKIESPLQREAEAAIVFFGEVNAGSVTRHIIRYVSR